VQGEAINLCLVLHYESVRDYGLETCWFVDTDACLMAICKLATSHQGKIEQGSKGLCVWLGYGAWVGDVCLSDHWQSQEAAISNKLSILYKRIMSWAIEVVLARCYIVHADGVIPNPMLASLLILACASVITWISPEHRMVGCILFTFG
jgi:hypothetical protein